MCWHSDEKSINKSEANLKEKHDYSKDQRITFDGYRVVGFLLAGGGFGVGVGR